MTRNYDCSITLRLSSVTREWLNTYFEGTSLSEKARECIESNMFNYEALELRKKELLEKIKLIEQAQEDNIFLNLNNLSKQETEWLKRSAETLKDPQNKDLFIGKYHYYKNHFHRRVSISDFRRLLEQNG